MSIGTIDEPGGFHTRTAVALKCLRYLGFQIASCKVIVVLCQVYACCLEPYPDVTFTIHMTRRSLFYIINLIFPCLLIYAVSFLGFFLPVESGEKVNLEITILLALVVFLLIVGETLPPTPDAIPVLGQSFISWCLIRSCLPRCRTKTFRKYSQAFRHC